MYRVALIYLLTVGLGMAPTLASAQEPPQQPPAAQQQQVEPPPILTVPPGYRYDPRGRRDPFVNPIPKPAAPEPEIPVVRPPGLRGVLVSEAIIIGIVTSREPQMNVAVIEAPGGKTYFGARGDELFDAVIQQIRTDEVVFQLSAPRRPGGETPPREVVRKVRTTPGE
jgi:hypothetical protein